MIYHCFPGGKHKCVTFSYDDGKLADRRLVQMFNQYDLKGTFHINGGLFHMEERIPASEIADLYQGHEVSGHTFTHPTISRIPKEAMAAQLMEDRKELESIVGYPVTGLSYPNGSHNKRIRELLPLLGYQYSRVVPPHHTYDLPTDYFNWEPTCHHNDKALDHAKEFVELKKTQYLYLLYIWGHSYEFDRDDNWDMMEEICQTLSHQDDIWYATNIDIVYYLNALEQLSYSADMTMVHNPWYKSLWISIDGKSRELLPGLNTL